ncbi:MAG TPA: glutamine amidotransferase [Acidimicrobiia bacterium]
MSSEIAIALLRPGLLGTYGDRGNATVLAVRLRKRGIPARVLDLDRGPAPTDADIYLLGGGEDGAQSAVAADTQLRSALHSAVDRGAVVLAVCAGFQLLGKSFETGGGATVKGFGVLDCKSRRREGERAVGEVFSKPRADLGLPTLTGFENHGGGTWLSPGLAPLGRLELGVGNGDGSGTEGAISKRVIGTYMHGPVLARNPALADLLLSWAVGKTLDPLPMPEVDRLRAERLAERRGSRMHS